MMKRLSLTITLTLAAQGILWATPTRSDIVIVWHEKHTTTQISTGDSGERVAEVKATIGDGMARLDWKSYSCIVDREKNSMVWIDHNLRSTSRLGLPLDLAGIFGDLFVVWQDFAPGLRPVEQAEVETVHGYAATTVQWKSTRGAPMVLKASMGQVPELDSREDQVLQLLENCYFVYPFVPKWVKQMRTYSGIPLQWTDETQLQAFDSVTIRDFKSIKKVEFSPKQYKPPGEYSQKPFDIREYVGVHGAGR